jgi:hypothetical protein
VSINYKSKRWLEYAGTALYITVDWISTYDSMRAGRTNTPFFSAYKTDKSAAEKALLAASRARSLVSYPEIEITPAEALSPQKNDPDSDSGTTVTGSNGGSSDSSDGAKKATSSSGKTSGLSTGAIIGIAVGCGAVAILVLGALVFFCLRRRRTRRRGGAAGGRGLKSEPGDHAHDGYESAPVNQDFMAEKGVNHQRVAESPHSPYSDNVAGGVSGGAPAAPGHDASMPRAGSATPLGLSRSVAALVEDGMTEDEIRRLDEEERALDAAIAEQQASRHR